MNGTQTELNAPTAQNNCSQRLHERDTGIEPSGHVFAMKLGKNKRVLWLALATMPCQQLPIGKAGW
jgi:hypothetical protein